MFGDFHVTFLHECPLQLLHQLSVPLAGLLVNHDRTGIVHTNDAARLSLYRHRSFPRLVDELDRYLGQLWDVPLDVETLGVNSTS